MSKKKDDSSKSLSELRAKYGRPDTEFLTTGSSVLDELWGGGTPSGKIIEIHSDAGVGKTTIAIQCAREGYLKAGLKVGFMDTEHALDAALKRVMDVEQYEFDDKDAPSFCHLSPAFYSEIEDTTYWFIKNGYKLLILDSLTNAVPDARKAEGASITDTRPGIKSMMQALYLEQFKPILARAGITLILINHMRTQINFLRPSVERPAGGKALQFDTDIRLGLVRKAWIEEMVDGEKVRVGSQIEMVTIKNKITVPFRAGNVIFKFGKGIDEIETIFTNLVNQKAIVQSGAYFSMKFLGDDAKNIQGKQAAIQVVRDNLIDAKVFLGNLTAVVQDGSPMEEASKSEFEN